MDSKRFFESRFDFPRWQFVPALVVAVALGCGPAARSRLSNQFPETPIDFGQIKRFSSEEQYHVARESIPRLAENTAIEFVDDERQDLPVMISARTFQPDPIQLGSSSPVFKLGLGSEAFDMSPDDHEAPTILVSSDRSRSWQQSRSGKGWGIKTREFLREGYPPLLISQTESSESNSPVTEMGFEQVDEPLSFWNDFHSAPTLLAKDLASLVSIENAVFLSAAGAGVIALRNHVDGQVQQSVDMHGPYWGGASHWLNTAGQTVVHAPVLAGLYWYSLYAQDAELHELALTFVTSYKFTAISTLVLQYATDTRHGPHGGLNALKDNGFPSMPASTSFALAAVVDEKFGWKGAIPAYLGAGLIGWAGIDQQQHHVSDVVFGAALGYVIGKSIGSMHYHPDATFKLIPFIDVATGSQGLQFEKQF